MTGVLKMINMVNSKVSDRMSIKIISETNKKANLLVVYDEEMI